MRHKKTSIRIEGLAPLPIPESSELARKVQVALQHAYQAYGRNQTKMSLFMPAEMPRAGLGKNIKIEIRVVEWKIDDEFPKRLPEIIGEVVHNYLIGLSNSGRYCHQRLVLETEVYCFDTHHLEPFVWTHESSESIGDQLKKTA